jgi:hypothetical protein
MHGLGHEGDEQAEVRNVSESYPRGQPHSGAPSTTCVVCRANRARHALPPHPRHVGLRRIRETVTTTVASLPEQRPPLKVRAGVTPG